MPGEWTEERRAAQRARAIKSGLGRKAEVSTAPSAEQMLIAKAQATPPVATREDLRSVVDAETMQGDRGTVEHTTADKVWVYKPTPYGYKRRQIPVTGLPQALKGGFLPHCPDCNSAGVDGQDCGDGPNDCPSRPKRLYRKCTVPSCGKKVYDYQLEEMEALESDDPSMIKDDAYIEATPALRTKALMDRHMLGIHPNEAAAAGIVAPSQRAVERKVPSGSAV